MNSWPRLWRQPARSDHSRLKAGCQGGEVGYGGWLWWHHTHEESLASVTPTASRSEDVTWPQNCLSLADVHWVGYLEVFIEKSGHNCFFTLSSVTPASISTSIYSSPSSLALTSLLVSTMTTLSAPAGTGAPMFILTTSPGARAAIPGSHPWPRPSPWLMFMSHWQRKASIFIFI